MIIPSPPSIPSNPALSSWLKDSLWTNLLSIPASIVVPSSSTAEGNPGQMAFDSDYLYLCIERNTWKRISLTAF